MQTAYNTDKVVANEGGIADFNPTDIISKACEDANIPFGRLVVRGTADSQCALPSATGDSPLGITLFTHKEQNVDGTTTYNQYDAVNVARKGVVFVKPETAVSAGDAVYFRHTAGAGDLTVGRFTDSAAVANADLLVGAVYDSDRDSDGFAKVSINLP